jgi:phenylpyruvate tautomerase PptA (4-oxalocrotonate tautomerase family)
MLRQPALALILLSIGLPVLGQQSQSSPSPSVSSQGPQADLTPDSNGNLSQEQMRRLIRVVTDNYRANYKKERDYTYIDRVVENKLDTRGGIKSSESKTYEIMELYGEPVERLIAKDDKPLPEKDAAREEEKIQKLADKRKNESQEERAKRLAQEEKQREKNREFVSEVADAYEFRLMGSESLNGRDNWVIGGEPRADFQAHMKEAQMLSKFHGRLWIDKSEMQLAKMDVEALDTVSFGWVLARIHKGTRLIFELTRVNDEVWLPQYVSFKFDARVALFKGYNEQDEETYRDYKKFRTSAKVIGIGEVQEK